MAAENYPKLYQKSVDKHRSVEYVIKGVLVFSWKIHTFFQLPGVLK